MSTQERPRDEKSKEKSKSKGTTSSIDDWLDTFDPETENEKVPTKIETQDKQEAQKVSEESVTKRKVSAGDVEELLLQFTRRLPNWISKPWMYVKPTHEGHYQNWITSWKKVILDYCEILTIHIVNIYDLQEVHPFQNSNNGKDLSIDELKSIISSMIEENLAKWLDDARIRIYFKTDEEWADIVYQFMLDNGYATDILTMYELINLKQTWSSLPDSELALVLDVLVDQDRAQWIGNDRDTIQFKL